MFCFYFLFHLSSLICIFFITVFSSSLTPSPFSGPGGHLGDGAAAPRLHDEDGELPEASRAEERSDRHRQPRHPREGETPCMYLLGERRLVTDFEIASMFEV